VSRHETMNRKGVMIVTLVSHSKTGIQNKQNKIMVVSTENLKPAAGMLYSCWALKKVIILFVTLI
jgi:hypothetical protein